jgi:hypothetical protein
MLAGLLLGLAISTTGLAAEVRGTYDGIGFTAFTSDDQATIVWDDGYPDITLPYEPNPVPAPRCRCDVYESAPRRLYIHIDFDGQPTYATYENSDQ